MVSYFRITEEKLHWFAPLLSQSEEAALKSRGDVYAIGAVCDKCACGILVFQLGEIADIRYLAVSEKYRRQGIATGMITFLCRYMWDSLTPVTCSFASKGLDDPIYLLFADMGNFSVAESGGYSCRVSLKELPENKVLAPLKGHKLNHPSFFSLTPSERKGFMQKMYEQNNFYLREIPEEQYRKDFCLCNMDGNEVKAAIFITQETGTPDLELAFAWCAPGRQKALIELLAQASAMVQGDSEGYLYISAVTPPSVAIVEKILPEREMLGSYCQAVWDMEL